MFQGIYPLTPKQLRNYMIARNGKVTHTKPECDFNDYQVSRGLNLIWDKTLPFSDPETGEHLDFQCDFLRPTEVSFNLDVEIDGEKYHSSPQQIAKDRWKDGIKNKSGLKVIHIPAIITQKRWWAYLDSELPLAFISPLPVVRIVA